MESIKVGDVFPDGVEFMHLPEPGDGKPVAYAASKGMHSDGLNALP